MANKKKEVTKAPSGLKITRSGNKFTASWKIGDKDYGDGQYLQYLINDTGKDKWKPTADSKKSIGVKVTSKAISIDKADFYPNKDKKGNNKPNLYEIGFRVKGNRKKYTTGSGKKKKTHTPVSSEWTEKRFTVNPPKKPTLTVELDEELTNVCTFSWSAPYASDDSYIFTDTQWQTILVKNNSETDGSKLSWKGSTFDEGTAGAESSKTITEDTAILYRDGNSYTRWFRVRSRGPRGVMNTDGKYGWVYRKHVYALPNKTNVTGTSAKETDEGGFQCIVDWTVGQSNNQKPIDKVTVQYTIVVPDENLSCPNGASWTDANISRDTADGDAAVFSIDDQLGKDQCLFIRVNTQHDSNTTYGKPELSSVGFIKDPTGLSVQTDNVTHKATINATNVSDVEDSVLVVRYVPAEGDPIDVGVIPHGSSSVTVQCPDWSEQTAIGFEVYAMVGEAVKQTREDGVDSYAVTPKMRSQNTVSQGGAVPVAPKNVNVSRVENKPDTVQVTWDWPWSEAGSAEISWSDHDDAWESTDEPESFLISNLHASKWNISGLETGKTWYVRVRLIAGNMSDSETVTYGPWSDISQGSIDLSSAPNKPVLILSDSIIPEDGSTTASWVYTTTDNTAQAYAEVAVVENGEYIPIAHSLTAQHVTIDAISAGFTVGNVYNLACMVKSASGRNSEWSDVVSVAVAEPLECDIPVSSLVFESKETNPREFEGNPIEFNTELNENIRKLEIELEPIQLGEGTPSPSNVRPIIGTQKVKAVDEGKNLADQRILLNLNPAVTYTDEEGYYLPKHYDTGFQALLFKNTKGIEGQMTLSFLCKTSDGVEGGYLQLYYTDGTRTRPNSPELRHDEFHLITIVSPADKTVDRVAYGYYTANKPTWFKNVQLELGTEATDYVPYVEPIEVSQEFDVSLTPTVIDRIPYLFKKTGDVKGDRESLELVGGTVAWNQLVRNGDFSDGTSRWSAAQGSFSVSSGEATVVTTGTYGQISHANMSYVSGHKYLMTAYAKSADSLNISVGASAMATNHIYTLVSSSYTLVGSVYNCTNPTGNTVVTVTTKNGGDNKTYTVKDVMCIDLTQMFGSTIADYIYSLEQGQAGAGVAWLRSYGFLTEDYMPYSQPTLQSVQATAHKTYDGDGNVLGNYALDSSLTLRGIPKLDASNNLYYDGDTYESDGTVTRKYGIVDLGSLDYAMFSSGYSRSRFRTTALETLIKKPPTNNTPVNAICSIYDIVNWATGNSTNVVGVFGVDTDGDLSVWLSNTAYPNATAFKTAMSGVYLVYELATPTTETADPFTDPQEVSIYGTEEFVSSNGVPVGNKTTYKTRDIFGGTIDLVSGVLTVDRAMVTLDGSSGENWSVGASSAHYRGYTYALSDIKPHSSNTQPTSAICDKIETGTWNDAFGGVLVLGQTGKAIGFGLDSLGITNYTDLNVWLSNNPITICYELATPTTYQLTPQQIQTLVGKNNVWSEQGEISLAYHIPITNLLVKRQDVADVSGNWLTLYSQPIEQASDMDFTFIDFLNQYGKTYKYALVPLLTQTQSGVEVEIEGGYTVSDNVDSIFDGVYIADQTNVERVKAGVGYGNIDMNQGVGSITPIGSKYPIVITNSQNQYHNGSVRGTIVPNDFYSNGNLSRIDMVNKRDELEQFLTNKRAKIIKDWNGKMWLVMIMSNVACSFDDNYGMGMVSFSADWLEVGDPTNQQDLYNAGLINVGGV